MIGSDRALEHVHGPVALQASLEGLQRLDGGGVLLSNEVDIKCFFAVFVVFGFPATNWDQSL